MIFTKDDRRVLHMIARSVLAMSLDLAALKMNVARIKATTGNIADDVRRLVDRLGSAEGDAAEIAAVAQELGGVADQLDMIDAMGGEPDAPPGETAPEASAEPAAEAA